MNFFPGKVQSELLRLIIQVKWIILLILTDKLLTNFY